MECHVWVLIRFWSLLRLLSMRLNRKWVAVIFDPWFQFFVGNWKIWAWYYLTNLGDWSPLHSTKTRWWFQTFFIFIPTWGNDPVWLIFVRWFETTNQKTISFILQALRWMPRHRRWLRHFHQGSGQRQPSCQGAEFRRGVEGEEEEKWDPANFREIWRILFHLARFLMPP